MASAVVLSTAQVELRTCKLTKSILRQFPIASNYQTLQRHRAFEKIARSPLEEDRYVKLLDKETLTEPEQREREQLAGKRSFTMILKDNTVGWIHRSVFGDDTADYLLLMAEPGQYVLWRGPHPDTLTKFPQLFIL